MAAPRGDPRVDRLCAEDPPDDDAEHETPESAPESAPGSAPETAPTAEVRLMPNVERLGWPRVLRVVPLRRVAAHREDAVARRGGLVASSPRTRRVRRRAENLRTTLETRTGYGCRHGCRPCAAALWRLTTKGKSFPARRTASHQRVRVRAPRVGPDGTTTPRRVVRGEGEGRRGAHLAVVALGVDVVVVVFAGQVGVTLYGFEDDARNARDSAGATSSTVCTGRRTICTIFRGSAGRWRRWRARADPTGSAASPCSRTSEEGGKGVMARRLLSVVARHSERQAVDLLFHRLSCRG